MISNTSQPFEALYPSGVPVEIEVEIPSFNMSGTASHFVTAVSVTADFNGYDTQDTLVTSVEESGPFQGYSTGTAFV